MSIRCDVVSEPDALRDVVGDWDALAVETRRPYCAPAWQLAWWCHVAPRDAELRVLLARDGETVVGIAPFYASRLAPGTWSYALLGAGFAFPIEPLARPDALAAVAAAFVGALASVRPPPDVIRLEGVRADSPWPALLGARWNGRRARLHRGEPVAAPYVTLAHESLDDWLATRSANFRQRMRRDRRGLEKQGAVFRTTQTPAEIDGDVAQLLRLNDARWSWRGGSNAALPGVDRMLIEAGRALVERRRFVIVAIEIGADAVASLLLVAAGGEIAYWNGGFHERWKRYSPTQVSLVEAVRLGLADGCTRLDLGPGAGPYKYRLADGEDALAPAWLVPPGRRHLLGRALLAPGRAHGELARRLTPGAKRHLRELGRRASLGRTRER